MDLFTAKKLTLLRKYHSLSQEALAEKIGVSRQAVSKWERGEASPDTDNILSISKLYEISVDDILGDKDAQTVIDEIEKKKSGAVIAPEISEEKNEAAENKISEEKNIPNKKPKQEKQETTRCQKAGKLLMRFPFFLAVIIIFLILGFSLSLWHPMWVIFFSIPTYYLTAFALKAPTKRKLLIRLPVYLYIVSLYIILGFTLNLWHPYWLIFLTLPFYYWFVLSKK